MFPLSNKTFTPAKTINLASATLSPRAPRKQSLPLEGTLYDPISLTNFIDLNDYKLTAALHKSIPSNALSSLLDADLPTKVTLSGKLGTLWLDGATISPTAKVAVSVRLLDLGASDARQKGFLRFKASARTTGKTDHGFEIDRRVQLFNMANTTLYGNVAYKTTNKSNGEWKTSSSFGVHQDCRLGRFRFAARFGMTPEGDFVYDLKL